MGKKQREKDSSQELKEQIESHLAEGRQCSQCLLLVLKDVIGVQDEVLTTATRTLGRGMGGTGGICGALTAGMLAIGLASQGRAQDTDTPAGVPVRFRRPGMPRNDFLDNYTPSEPPEFAKCRELVSRFTAEVVPHVGSSNCRDISGIDWSRPGADDLSWYYAQGGAISRCAEVIASTAEIVKELVEVQRRQAS